MQNIKCKYEIIEYLYIYIVYCIVNVLFYQKNLNMFELQYIILFIAIYLLNYLLLYYKCI